jgi:anthranilate synthase component I
VPSLETVRAVLAEVSHNGDTKRPNLVPMYGQLSSDLITPSAAYLKISAHISSTSSAGNKNTTTSPDRSRNRDGQCSFLFESAATERVGRWSFVGAGPRKVMRTGDGFGIAGDPLPALEEELGRFVVADVPGLKLPPLTGGAIGYVGYDCVRYWEPKTARPMVDVLKVGDTFRGIWLRGLTERQIPESLFMLFDTVRILASMILHHKITWPLTPPSQIVAFDRFFGVIKVITYLHVPEDTADLATEYARGQATIAELIDVLNSPEIPLPPQKPVTLGREYTSNVGQAGYEAHVTALKKHIVRGDIIQAVPSQRLARPTDLHPFNIYRHLRTVNPSPYLFYLDCGDFAIVGASPELLVKTEPESSSSAEETTRRRVITHPIAGTVRRGATTEEDDALATELRGSLKDRAEHVMLVDLARNDVNRVCEPTTTRVDRLMVVERFSHVQHLVSQVSGVLRSDQTRFDAFRSIFPAGTVSGAPKVKAMELIAELEGEKRGVYAGAVGYFGYSSLKGGEGAMDTCIALRTMLYKDGVVYLQAGGGIVFDSDEYDEYVETLNKLMANTQCIVSAEKTYAAQQKAGRRG